MGIESEIREKLSPRSFLQEFLVDILGGLVPGILFISGILVAMIAPVYELIVTFSHGDRSLTFDSICSLLSSTSGTPGTLWFFMFIGIFLLTYIVGHMFFRRDPKRPDRASFDRLLYYEVKDLLRELLFGKGPKVVSRKFLLNEEAEEFTLPRWCTVLSKTKLKGLVLWIILKLRRRWRKELGKQLSSFMSQNYGADSRDNCEFPYPDLNEYLLKRGLNHLEKFVVWRKDDSKLKRSKVHMNILKVRLTQFFPEKCKQIIRNEAHVRLASSTWYVTTSLFYASLLGISLVVISAYGLGVGTQNVSASTIFGMYFPALLYPLIVLLMSFYFRGKINSFLHYQRMREVIFVLETAFTVFRFEQYQKILDPPFVDVYKDVGTIPG